MALDLYKHFNYGTLTKPQVDSNWTDIESEVNGLSGRLPLNNYSATTNPTVNNDVTQGYSNGSLWYNRTTDTVFVLTNASSGAANWVERDSISASDLGSAAFADILGTVSQSGGVPTGALIERGSNANGEYFKYAGGLLVCSTSNISASATIDAGTSASGNWVYPSTFAAGAVVIPKVWSFSNEGATVNMAAAVNLAASAGASSAFWAAHNFSASSVGTVRVDLLALGGWY